MRVFIVGVLFLTVLHAQAASSPFDLHLQVYPNGDQFQIMADYKVGLSPCQAVAYLRDYEGAKTIPGIKESKVISRSGNQVKVERVVEDRIMLILITMRSVVQYKELTEQILDFEQISGDAKVYKGTWRLDPDGEGTRFQFRAHVEVSTIVPQLVVEYFIKNQMSKRFEAMAEHATQRFAQKQFSCK
jgi:ribosome-associated toxin RatA of RatAB toxin-antitoxin module